MTLPGGAGNVTIPDSLPAILFPMSPPTLPTRGISSGYSLTQENVEEELKRQKVRDNPKLRKPKSDVDNWVLDLAESFGEAAANVWKFLQWLPLIGDALEFIADNEDGDTDDLGTLLNKLRQQQRDAWNMFVNQLLGWDGFDWSSSNAEQAFGDTAATIAGLSASVTALINDKNNAAVGGVGVTVDLTGLTSGSTFGADFDHFRSGGGGHYSIVNGVGARWDPVNDTDATDAFLYNALETTTDYQMIWIAFGAAPVWFNALASARNEIHGRKNADGDTYVFAGLEKFKCDLGCVVGGVKTVFDTKSTGFSFKANTLYGLECGTVGGLRIFRIWEGNKVVFTHTEVGTTSQAGAGYRGAGGSGFARASGLGTTPPGLLWAFAMADNQPTTVVGSGATISRTNTADTTASSGNNLFGTSFFDTLGANTPDIAVDLSAGKFTVSIPGWYVIDARVKIDASDMPVPLQLLLYKNNGGVGAEVIPIGNPIGWLADDQGSSVVHKVPGCIAGGIELFLDEGDYVQLGYHANTTEASFWSGEASGLETVLTIALANRSLA